MVVMSKRIALGNRSKFVPLPSVQLVAMEKVDPTEFAAIPTVVHASQLKLRGKSFRPCGVVGKRGVILRK